MAQTVAITAFMPVLGCISRRPLLPPLRTALAERRDVPLIKWTDSPAYLIGSRGSIAPGPCLGAAGCAPSPSVPIVLKNEAEASSRFNVERFQCPTRTRYLFLLTVTYTYKSVGSKPIGRKRHVIRKIGTSC